MKRFHVHLGVPDLPASIRFYSNLFGTAPNVQSPTTQSGCWTILGQFRDLAPRSHGGLNHLGVQAESAEGTRRHPNPVRAADASATVDEPRRALLLREIDKHWVTDPQGIAWEAFHTLESIPLFGAVQEAAETAGRRLLLTEHRG